MHFWSPGARAARLAGPGGWVCDPSWVKLPDLSTIRRAARKAREAAADVTPRAVPDERTEAEIEAGQDRSSSTVVWGAVSAVGVLLAGVIGFAALALIGWAIDHPDGASAGSAMQVGLQGWFLAHGVTLPVSWGSLSVPPLLASAAVAYLFYRSGRSTARSLGLSRLAEHAEVAAAYAEVNDSRYGLHCAIYTSSLETAFAAIESIEAGGVVVNEVPGFRSDIAPYGGVKDSGIGREGPRFAIEEMTVTRMAVIRP